MFPHLSFEFLGIKIDFDYSFYHTSNTYKDENNKKTPIFITTCC